MDSINIFRKDKTDHLVSDNSPDNRIEKYTKKELATLLNVVEEDMR